MYPQTPAESWTLVIVDELYRDAHHCNWGSVKDRQFSDYCALLWLIKVNTPQSLCPHILSTKETPSILLALYLWVGLRRHGFISAKIKLQDSRPRALRSVFLARRRTYLCRLILFARRGIRMVARSVHISISRDIVNMIDIA